MSVAPQGEASVLARVFGTAGFPSSVLLANKLVRERRKARVLRPKPGHGLLLPDFLYQPRISRPAGQATGVEANRLSWQDQLRLVCLPPVHARRSDLAALSIRYDVQRTYSSREH